MSVLNSISVLMPVFNAEDTVSEAIESILHQTDPDFEFIIVDDGSTDATPEIIKEQARNDQRIRPFFNEHRGIVTALEYGLEQTSGSYIARMDADDLSHPRRLEKQRHFLDINPYTGLVACLVEHLGDKKKKAGYARYVKWINSLTGHEEISLNRFIESPLAHPSVMFRRTVLKRFGGYRQGNFPEDYELWLRWLERGVRMEKVPEVLLQWQDKHSRLSRTHDRYSFEAFYTIKAVYLARWLSRNNPHHPDVVVWGAGRTSRKRAEMLTEHGVNIVRYIDVDSNKIGQIVRGRPVSGPDEIPEAGTCFIVSYVALHGVNAGIRRRLTTLDYREGIHYLFAA